LLGGEQQGHVDRNPGEDDLLDGGQALRGPGYLDEQVGAVGLRVQRLGLLDRGCSVIGEQRRHFERNEAVDRGAPRMNGGKQVGGPGEVLHGEVEEQSLSRPARIELAMDLGIIGVAARNRVIEDRRV
jgi:hypothetical protein